jgi:ribosome-binding factor A
MVASVVRETIAPVLRECPQACGIVTITEVEVSRDFSYATCYVSALENVREAIAFLSSQIPDLQGRLGAALQIHRVPRIRFRIDPRTERGRRIDRLLGA